MPSSTISIVRLMELEVCAAAEAGDVATVAQRVRPAGAGAGPSSAASASASSSSSSAAPAGPLINAECTNEVRRQRRQMRQRAKRQTRAPAARGHPLPRMRARACASSFRLMHPYTTCASPDTARALPSFCSAA